MKNTLRKDKAGELVGLNQSRIAKIEHDPSSSVLGSYFEDPEMH